MGLSCTRMPSPSGWMRTACAQVLWSSGLSVNMKVKLGWDLNFHLSDKCWAWSLKTVCEGRFSLCWRQYTLVTVSRRVNALRVRWLGSVSCPCLGEGPCPVGAFKTLEANGLARLGLACGNYWGVWKLKEWRNQVPLWVFLPQAVSLQLLFLCLGSCPSHRASAFLAPVLPNLQALEMPSAFSLPTEGRACGSSWSLGCLPVSCFSVTCVTNSLGQFPSTLEP